MQGKYSRCGDNTLLSKLTTVKENTNLQKHEVNMTCLYIPCHAVQQMFGKFFSLYVK